MLIDCALSKLLAEGSIVVAEIFVFSRAIEDVVDLLLIRSRSESELATLMTQVEKLSSLDEVWSKSKEARLLPCNIGSTSGIELSNLQYSRGTASVNVEQLVLEPVYMLLREQMVAARVRYSAYSWLVNQTNGQSIYMRVLYLEHRLISGISRTTLVLHRIVMIVK